MNVLNNAVKFTPEGGSVTLEMTEKVSDESLLSANVADKENAIGKENAVGKENTISKENVIGKDNTEEKVYYVFHVKDTGIGMDEEFQKHAFEAFERERTSTESKIEGTGLGLAIVKKLVELMNGQVTIQSSRGQGTDICIALPLKLAQSGAVAESEIPDVDIDLTGERVLLVEDNELNAEIALEILKNAGLQADWVTDGRACIEHLEACDAAYYQFILMDIQMPKLNGYDAARQIRQMPDAQKAHIPIIAMTANAFDDDKRKALEAGMDGFITKPIEVDKMMQTIKNQKVRKQNERII